PLERKSFLVGIDTIKQKSPGPCRGLSLLEMQIGSIPGAVAAKFVADAAGDQADICPGVGGDGGDCQVRRQESAAVALSEDIIVFNAGSPIRRETVLPSHTDGTAPTGPFCLRDANAGEGIEDVKALVCDGS